MYKTFYYPTFFICLGLLLLYPERNYAADYYFSSSTGNDNRSLEVAQSSLTPWATIQKLNEISSSLKPGDRVFFRRGDVFHGTIRLTRGGANGHPVLFDAYGTGDLPIITSLVKVKEWVSIGNGVYQANISKLKLSKIKIVLINDQLKEVGRYPNTDNGNSGYLTINSLNDDFSINGDELPFDAKGGEIVIRKNHWIIDSYPIKQSQSGRIDFWNQGTSIYTPIKGFGYFIQNHVEALDQLGEWSYSEMQKTLSVYFGGNKPTESSVEVASSDYLLVTNFLVQNLTFKNIHFKGSNKNLINIEKSSNVLIDNCQMEYAGENAVYSYSTPDFTIKNCEINYALSGAIFFWHGTPRAIISDNVIEHSMPFQGMSKNSDLNGIGIYIAGDADDSKITSNRVINSGYNGIHFGGNNSIVKNNLVDNFCLWKQDGGGIYMNSDGLTTINNAGREIVGNIVLNGIGASEGTNQDYNIAEGIYLDDNTKGVKVNGNTIAHINGKGIYLHNANTIDIVENLIYDCEVQIQLTHDNLGNPVRGIKIDANQLSSVRDGEMIYSISSIKNDIEKIGVISNNYILDPFQNEFMVASKEPGDPSYGLKRSFENWSGTYGFDSSSKMQKFSFDRFQVLNQEVLKKSDFKTDIKTVSGTYNATSKWVSSGIDGGTLSVTPNSSKAALVYIQLGKVSKGDKILVEMNVKGISDIQALEMFLEKTFDTNQEGAVKYFSSSKNGKKVQVFLNAMVDSEMESLVFRIPSDLSILFFDNLEVAKVTTKKITDQMFFQYNYSEEMVNLPLNGTYTDPKGQEFKDSISIDPYKSVLLLKVGQ